VARTALRWFAAGGGGGSGALDDDALEFDRPRERKSYIDGGALRAALLLLLRLRSAAAAALAEAPLSARRECSAPRALAPPSRRLFAGGGASAAGETSDVASLKLSRASAATRALFRVAAVEAGATPPLDATSAAAGAAAAAAGGAAALAPAIGLFWSSVSFENNCSLSIAPVFSCESRSDIVDLLLAMESTTANPPK
jgi:hypothetical protein